MHHATKLRRRRAVLTFLSRCCSKWGLHWPNMSPYLRWALTSPFHTYHYKWRLFSVALSLRFPSLDVIQHHCSMEPGLSSYAAFRPCYTRLFNLLLFDILKYYIKFVNTAIVYNFSNIKKIWLFYKIFNSWIAFLYLK